ncbi:MAG: DegV family EDD domain-containing protein [Clostridiales bacterium]|nr:DegV family EDD domain-containing protein [Clostridiales bacterium]
MNQQRIAILTDSGTDVPQAFSRTHDIRTLPLSIRFSEGDYLDGVTISPEEVYSRLPVEIPKTSLPAADTVRSTLADLQKEGYKTVFIITISSALSGTYNLMRLCAADFPNLDCRLIDTRNIGIGAGFTVMRAAEMVRGGFGADRIEETLRGLVKTPRCFSAFRPLNTLQRAAVSAR